MNYLVAGLLLLMMIGYPLAADEVDVVVSPNRVIIGQPFHYQVSVLTPDVAGSEIRIPKSPDLLHEVSSSRNLLMAPDGKRLVKTIHYRAFDVGQLIIPTGSISIPGKTIELPSSIITVESILTTENMSAGYQDITPLETISPRAYVFRWVLLLLAGAAIAGLFFWWLRRRKAVEPDVAPVFPGDTRSPDEIALEALSRLRESGLLKSGQVSLYYFKISVILKLYFTSRFTTNFLDKTTEELLSGFDAFSDDQTLRRVKNVLELCDLAKFAAYVPNEAEHDECFERAVDIIQRTRIVTEDTSLS